MFYDVMIEIDSRDDITGDTQESLLHESKSMIQYTLWVGDRAIGFHRKLATHWACIAKMGLKFEQSAVFMVSIESP